MTDETQPIDSPETLRRNRMDPSRIVTLGSGEAMHEWPGRTADLKTSELMKIDRGSAIVYGEKKSGFGALRRWCIRRCKRDVPVVLIWVDGAGRPVRVDTERFQTKVADPEISQNLMKTITADTDAGVMTGLDSFLDRVMGKTKPENSGEIFPRPTESPPVLFITGFDLLKPKYPGFWGILRGHAEGTPRRMNIVGFVRRPLRTDDANFDSFVSDVTRHYRIAPWNVADIQRAIASSVSRSNKSSEPGALKELCWRTGGQPRLVDLCLSLMRDETITEAQVQKATHELLHGPPDVVSQWTAVLKSILRDDPELVPIFRGYVEGTRRSIEAGDRPTRRELPLYASGWVGYDEETETWGIRSWLHQGWAYSLLRELPGGRR